MFKKFLGVCAAVFLLSFGVANAADWSCGPGTACTKKIVFTSGGASTADYGMQKIMNMYMMPAAYVSSADDSVTITLIGADTGRDYLDGNGTLTTATTAGTISSDDRWVIGETLTPTISGLGSGTFTIIFTVAE
jgi:hypothetical protein